MFELTNLFPPNTSALVILSFIFTLIWVSIWKLLAMWKSARKGSVPWFIILALVNTFGILEILYLFVFSEMKLKARKNKSNQKSKKKRKR